MLLTTQVIHSIVQVGVAEINAIIEMQQTWKIRHDSVLIMGNWFRFRLLPYSLISDPFTLLSGLGGNFTRVFKNRLYIWAEDIMLSYTLLLYLEPTCQLLIIFLFHVVSSHTS